jgi:hypothetical protein
MTAMTMLQPARSGDQLGETKENLYRASGMDGVVDVTVCDCTYCCMHGTRLRPEKSVLFWDSQ